MIPQKAYILRIDDPISHEYAQIAANSCDKVGLPWKYFDNGKKGDKQGNPWNSEVLEKLSLKKQPPGSKGPAAYATLGHFLIWKKIADNKECAIILEHDSLLLHKPTFECEDDVMVVLGYKVVDPDNYDSSTAGPPHTLEDRQKHGGAHAYAMNHVTAESLLKNIRDGKRVNYIDNQFFLTSSSRGHVKMKITNPICALGWLRKSTIWTKSAVDNYGPILDSFKSHYNSKENLGIKK